MKQFITYSLLLFTFLASAQTKNVFDSNAKMLKEINTEITNQNNSVDLKELTTGMYFMELSNDSDQVVKKIIINQSEI
jgi:hypothetical protein